MKMAKMTSSVRINQDFAPLKVTKLACVTHTTTPFARNPVLHPRRFYLGLGAALFISEAFGGALASQIAGVLPPRNTPFYKNTGHL